LKLRSHRFSRLVLAAIPAAGVILWMGAGRGGPGEAPASRDTGVSRAAAPAASAHAAWEQATGAAPAAYPNPDVPLSQAALEGNATAVALANQTNFAAAAAILRELLVANPTAEVLRRNLQTVLLAWAMAAKSDGDATLAETLLHEADSLGERVGVWQVLGSLLLDRGDFAAAAELLEQALRADPTRDDVGLALAQAYTELDQRSHALDALLRVRDAGSAGTAVNTMIDRLSREVDAEWDFMRVETPHFHLDFNGDVAAHTVEFVAAHLDEAYADVAAKLGVYLDEPARAVLYADEDFHTLTQTPDWTQGVFDGRIKIPLRGLAENEPTLPTVLRHEYAHHVIAELSGDRCPVWLNEGIAMWAEELADERLLWAEERVLDATLAPLRQLQQSFARLDEANAELAYAHSYLAVRRLADDFGSAALVDLLRGLGEGRSFESEFSSVFGRNFQSFERTFAAELAQTYGAGATR